MLRPTPYLGSHISEGGDSDASDSSVVKRSKAINPGVPVSDGAKARSWEVRPRRHAPSCAMQTQGASVSC